MQHLVQSLLLKLHSGSRNEICQMVSDGLLFCYDGLMAQGNHIEKIIRGMRQELGKGRITRIRGERWVSWKRNGLNLVGGSYQLEYLKTEEGTTVQREFNCLLVFEGTVASFAMIQSIPSHSSFIKIVEINEDVHFWKESDLLYVESQREHALWHGRTDSVRSVASLSKIKEQLSDDFVQVHRCYLVNVNMISSIQRCSVTMNNGDQIPVPYKKYTRVKAEICGKRGW